MHYVALAQLLALLALANGTPVIAKRIFGENYAIGQCPFRRWTGAVRPVQDYSRGCGLVAGNGVGSDTARPSTLAWTVGGEHRHGWRLAI